MAFIVLLVASNIKYYNSFSDTNRFAFNYFILGHFERITIKRINHVYNLTQATSYHEMTKRSFY